jgi:hypothetical protein
MKTNFFRKYTFGASLLLLSLLAGCTRQASDPQPTATNAQAGSNSASVMLASAAPGAETSGTPDPAPPATPAPPPDPGPVPIAPDNSTTANELPPNIYPTSPLAQVIRLTQAGVDESIIKTFVAHSSGTFNLDSDKIIYLRDIGVPNEVVTAMMQRDQQLQQQMAAANQPPAQPAPDTNAETEPPPPPADQPAPPPTEVTVNYFYSTLAPYGSWVNVDGYGRCWRPSVVVYNPGWQPYCDHGHWIYTDCGWYWYSDYSWGWAPFHYGRWFQLPRWGWCWTPDTVWGPSWVTWRYSSGFCGWAPLPPFAMYQPGVGFFYRGSAVSIGFNWGLSASCFTFVPTQFFCDPYPRRHCVAPAQVPQIFNQTTVINNFNGHGRNLVNRGIDPERITAVTRIPIRPVALQNATSTSGPGPHRDQFSRDGSTLIVNQPGFVDHPASGGNWNNRPSQAGPPAQNYFPQPNDNQPVMTTHSVRQSPVPIVTTRGPQEGNAVRIPHQSPMPPASYNSSPAPAPTAPNNNNRTDSPRGREQTQSRGNAYNSGAPAVPSPDQGQPSAPAAAPAQQHPQHSQPSSSQSSSGQSQNQSGASNNSGNSPGSSPRH